MGYLVGPTCYQTLQEASDAYYSALPILNFPSSTAGALDQVVYFKNTTSGSWSMIVYNIVANVRTVESNISLWAADSKFPTCTPGAYNVTMFNDGLAMGWGVVAAMFAALAVIFIAKALK